MSDSSPKHNEDILAQGIIQLLTPVVTECDTRVQEVLTSQSELTAQIDLLSEELTKFMDVSKMPHLTPYVQKLNNARTRMSNINATLTQINNRLDNIQKSVL